MFTRHVLLLLTFLADLPNGTALRNVDLSSISATSRIGSKLLSKARKLNNNNDEEEDTTWVMGYSLKFQSCHAVGNIFGAEGAREEEGRIGTQNLVTFKLCPSEKCSTSCTNGGEYVVQMREFVEAYLEAEEEALERACESANEACEDYCDALDDDANDDENCRYQCMVEKNMDKCNEEEQEEDDKYPNWDFEEKEFMECRELEIGDDDGGPQYYVGPTCSKSGRAIYLSVFSDGGCTTKADSSIINDYYGKSLPYENESIVSSKCISCLEENDADDDGNNEPSELCQQLHEQAGRCEKSLKLPSAYSSYYTISTESCNYIHKTLPALTKVANSEGSALVVATTLAWVFGIGCVALGGLVFYMHKQGNKSGINLLHSDGTSA